MKEFIIIVKIPDGDYSELEIWVEEAQDANPKWKMSIESTDEEEDDSDYLNEDDDFDNYDDDEE